MAKPRRLDFEMRRGDTPGFSFDVYRINEAADPPTKLPVDLTLGGTTIVLTAKKKRTDAVPFFTRSVGSGITVNDPATADKNWATVKLAAANTSALLEDTDLEHDVVVSLPDGTIMTVIEGLAYVRIDVGT